MTEASTIVPAPKAADPVLSVRGLSVEFVTRGGPLVVVEDVSFDVPPATTVGLVGESGSGKSVTALAILRLLGRNGRIRSGEIRLSGRELTSLSDSEMHRIRGCEAAMIFQEPRRSLDPAFAVGDQIAEIVRRHLGLSRRDAQARAIELLQRVHIPQAARRAGDYPHQFSGGMCQRVLCAMAIAASPKLLIADEPTTALDVTVQAQILDLIRELQSELSLGVLFITHDLGVVAEMCDQVIVAYAGQIVESAPSIDLFYHPRHPYTQALLDSLPQAGDSRLVQIPGSMPSAGQFASGCRFAPRCAYASNRCTEDGGVSFLAFGEGRSVRCVHADEIELRGIR